MLNKKSNWGLKKFAAAMCITAMGFTSLGLGLGIGNSLERLFRTGANSISSEVYAAQGAETTESAVTGEVQFLNSFVAAQGYSVTDIFRSVSDSIVSINCKSQVQMFNMTLDTPSAGSGIIFAEDDEKIYVATNNHVIEGATSVTISLDDENQAEAHYLGSDYTADLAVLYVTKEVLAEAGIMNYGIARFGDSDALEIGEPAIAIGNALGEGKSATLGIISATNKTIKVDAARTLKLIQTDAAINPGNSGGALVNSRGEIIGVNTVKIMETGVEGMGYSIPSNTVVAIIEDLAVNGMIEKPYLGVSGDTLDEETRDKYSFASTGVYVEKVTSGSGASEGGLRPGDLIVRFGDIAINTWEDLVEALSDTKTGEIVDVYIFRNRTRPMTLQIEIKNMNATADF